MSIKQTIVIFTTITLLLSLGFLTGCSGTDGATDPTDPTDSTDSTEESIEAAQAKNDKTEDAGETKDGESGEEDERKEEAVPVEIRELVFGPIESILAYSANLEAERQVMVVAQAQRQVTKLLVEEGDRVKRGQLLLHLQDGEQRSALAKVTSQVAKAEREFERQQRLFKQELISEEMYNNSSYELEQLRISEADARRELGYTEVRAPISGTVTARAVNLGDQVQIGQELFELIDFDSIVARIYVPEKHLNELMTGLPANISAQAVPGLDFACSVGRIAPIVDPKSGTIKVTVHVGAKPGLRPGMYVDVNLITATHNEAVLVPKRAVIYDNDQMYVYRMKGEDRVERIFIQPLLTDKFHVEPVSGLEAGDRVIVAGQAGLKEGALVKFAGEETGAELDMDDDADAEIVERAAL